MNIGQHINNAWTDLSRNRLRTGLSMLGIIIWVLSVIVMMAIGNGTQQDIVERINSMGTNLLSVSPGWSSNIRGFGGGAGDKATLDQDMVEYINANVSNIWEIVPVVQGSKQVIYESNNTNATVIGVTPAYLEVRNLEMLNGSFIIQDDVDTMAKYAVLGNGIAEDLFANADPIGKDLKMENTIVTIIGVLDENSSADNTVLIPITTAQIRILGTRDYSQLYISAADNDIIEKTQDDLESSLTSYLGFEEGDELNFSVSSQEDMLEMVSDITGVMTTFLAGIAAISLLVGGIGVMNIMLVSVTERIKEIGIRKAIWATYMDILSQFLAESVLLSLLGGTIWVILSFLIVLLLNNFMTAVISSGSIILAFVSAVSIGMVFGILPARNAAKLKPIDALRFE